MTRQGRIPTEFGEVSTGDNRAVQGLERCGKGTAFPDIDEEPTLIGSVDDLEGLDVALEVGTPAPVRRTVLPQCVDEFG